MTATVFIAQHDGNASPANLAKLRSMRNAVIGSRTRKSEIVAQGKVPELVALLASSKTNDEARTLAATIISSLAHAATPPTLLSLCRAGATDAILSALGDLAKRMADLASATTSSPPSTDNDQYLSQTQNLRLLESFLRALRSILMALADEVAPGSKWHRGLGLSVSSSKGTSTSTRFGSAGQSVREVVGWHMADAGFETDGDAKMFAQDVQNGVNDAKHPTGLRKHALVPPQEELMLLARRAIAHAFHPTNLRLWLGALFIAKLPTTSKKLPSSRPGSAAHSRSSTRPASPALAQNSLSKATPGIPRSSSLSNSPTSAYLVGVSDSMRDNQSNHARILTIVEMVSGMLSCCIGVAYEDKDIAPNLSSDADEHDEYTTPGDVIAQRRRMVLDFRAADSAYWIANGPKDEREERGRHAATSSSFDGPLNTSRGSFFKRGKSIDGRAMDVEQQQNATAQQRLTEQHEASPFVKYDASVLDVLLEAVESGYAKTQEAALWALTDLARENTDTSRSLISCATPSGMIPTSMLLNMRKDPSVSVRLAAFCCLAHIIKVHPFTARTNECVLAVLVELMEVPGEVQVTAILALARLVADDCDLQLLACERYDCIEKLGVLLSKSKMTAVSEENFGETDGGRSMTASFDSVLERLREATLTALAALSFQRDEIRRRLVDLTNPSLLPLIVVSTTASHVGIRIAACRLVRALSRSISILRTSLVDAGVAPRLLAILQDDQENIHVKSEAIASMCNLVLKFSPMRQTILDGGGVARLVDLIKNSSDGCMRLNALWLMKNILYSADTALKVQVMDQLGWMYVRELALASVDVDLQEQALNVVRNVCNNCDDDIEATLRGFGGGEALLDMLEEVIWQRRNEAILAQAAFVLVNLTTGTDEHRKLIIERPNVLDAFVYFLNHPRAEIRVAGIWAATNLTQPLRTPLHVKPHPSSSSVTMEAVKRLKWFGFDKRLKELVDDAERDVSDRARGLIARFE